MHLSSGPFSGCHSVEGSYYWFHTEQLRHLKALSSGLGLVCFFHKIKFDYFSCNYGKINEHKF